MQTIRLKQCTTEGKHRSMLVAVITRDGRMVGLYTSQVDAWQAAKQIGAVMWRCSPNSDQCVAIQRAMTPERREDARVGADCPRARGGPPVSDAIDSTHANTRFTTSEV